MSGTSLWCEEIEDELASLILLFTVGVAGKEHPAGGSDLLDSRQFFNIALIERLRVDKPHSQSPHIEALASVGCRERSGCFFVPV
jgi:hypothetical protein